MKKRKVVTIWMGMLLATMIFSGCAGTTHEEDDRDAIYEESDREEDFETEDESEDDEAADTQRTADDELITEDEVVNNDVEETEVVEDKAESVSDGVQRIGSDVTGYVDVPYDFVRFVNDVDLGQDTIQYSDMEGKNIVTLQCFDPDVIDARTSAEYMYEQFASDPMVDSESLVAAMVTIDECEAYQVYCYYPELDTFVVTWSFDSPHDDYVHYVAVEFTSENFGLYEMVENTYHVVDEME